MNLYAFLPHRAPGSGVTFMLGESAEDALSHGIFCAAFDAVQEYGSLKADVFLVAENVKFVGTAVATDAPKEWDWAHPDVAEVAAAEVVDEVAWDAGLEGDLS